jgi:hypothetical protein
MNVTGVAVSTVTCRAPSESRTVTGVAGPCDGLGASDSDYARQTVTGVTVTPSPSQRPDRSDRDSGRWRALAEALTVTAIGPRGA